MICEVKKDLIRLEMRLESFLPLPFYKERFEVLKNRGFTFKVVRQSGNFSEYIDYVNLNKKILSAEKAYAENILLKRKSWGEIIIVKNKKGKIVASFGPNRLKKEGGKIRAMPGYFFVLPKFRNQSIGTVLWNIGLQRFKKMGADFIRCSVKKDNLPAVKIYLASGMKKVGDE